MFKTRWPVLVATEGEPANVEQAQARKDGHSQNKAGHYHRYGVPVQSQFFEIGDYGMVLYASDRLQQ